VSLCDDLLRLTRSYLDYAGIIQGSRPLCLGSFTIGALIQEIGRQFAPVAATRQVHWESHVLTPEATVVTDASRCQQIVGNMVSKHLRGEIGLTSVVGQGTSVFVRFPLTPDRARTREGSGPEAARNRSPAADATEASGRLARRRG